MLENEGINNINELITNNYQIGLKLGYLNKIRFNYTEFELGVLFDYELLMEEAYGVDDSEKSRASIDYNRQETVTNLKINARWTFWKL